MSKGECPSGTTDLTLIKSLLTEEKPSNGFYTSEEEETENKDKISDAATPQIVLHLNETEDKPAAPTRDPTKKKNRKPKQRKPHPDEVDSDAILKEKYEELYQLLREECSEEPGRPSQEMVQLKKHALKMFSANQMVRPPSGRPPTNRRLIPTVQDDKTKIIFIDATEGPSGSTKLVSFSNQASYSTDGRKSMRPTSAITRSNKVSTGAKRPQSATIPRSHKTSSSSQPEKSTASSNESEVKDSRKGRKNARSPTSSSGSRSRSRSEEKSSDHLLKNNSNPVIQEWLKKKNKLLRQQKTEERKKRRAERKKKSAELQEKSVRQNKSDESVRNWFRNKRNEERLLRKRAQLEKKQTIKVDLTKAVVEEHIVALTEADDLTSEVLEPEQEVLRKEKQTSSTDDSKCTCGYVDTLKLTEEKERQGRMIHRQRATSAKMARRLHSPKSRPQSSRSEDKSPHRHSRNSEDQARLSYDEWLKKKHAADEEKKKTEEQKKLLSHSDPANTKLISDLARRRIDRINEGKKTIDTGVFRVDAAANSYLEPSEPPRPSYRLEGEKPRPSSAQPKATKKRATHFQQRPASAGAQNLKTLSLSYPAASKKHSEMPPKPRTKITDSYKSVKYQQRSWDDFSDHLWEELNQEEKQFKLEAERLEPQGSEAPDHSPEIPAAETEDVTHESGTKLEAAGCLEEDEELPSESDEEASEVTEQPDAVETDDGKVYLTEVEDKSEPPKDEAGEADAQPEDRLDESSLAEAEEADQSAEKPDEISCDITDGVTREEVEDKSSEELDEVTNDDAGEANPEEVEEVGQSAENDNEIINGDADETTRAEEGAEKFDEITSRDKTQSESEQVGLDDKDDETGSVHSLEATSDDGTMEHTTDAKSNGRHVRFSVSLEEIIPREEFSDGEMTEYDTEYAESEGRQTTYDNVSEWGGLELGESLNLADDAY